MQPGLRLCLSFPTQILKVVILAMFLLATLLFIFSIFGFRSVISSSFNAELFNTEAVLPLLEPVYWFSFAASLALFFTYFRRRRSQFTPLIALIRENALLILCNSLAAAPFLALILT